MSSSPDSAEVSSSPDSAEVCSPPDSAELRLFDSHVHLDAIEEPLRDAWLAGAASSGVRAAVVPGRFPQQWSDLMDWLAQREPASLRVWGAVGLHPYFTDGEDIAADVLVERLDALLAPLLATRGVVALGEVGLDKLRGAALDRQVEFFSAQWKLACERDLPVICHQVGARQEFLRVVERAGRRFPGAIVHGFGGDAAWARALVRRGFVLGVGAGVLHPARRRLREAIVATPWTHLVVESDDLAGASPADSLVRFRETLSELARLKGCSLEHAAESTWQTAARVYRLPLP